MSGRYVAFLSDEAFHGQDPAVLEVLARSPEGQRAAVDEASMIAASAEPDVDGWGKIPFPTLHPFKGFDGEAWAGPEVDWVSTIARDNRAAANMVPDMFEALRDALAAFLAAPIPPTTCEREYSTIGSLCDRQRGHEGPCGGDTRRAAALRSLQLRPSVEVDGANVRAAWGCR